MLSPDSLGDMHVFIELTGYVASALVFSTFYMKTMMPLRCTAICSNVAFMIYGMLYPIYPILILHAFLLPLNTCRLWQQKKLMADVSEAAKGDLSIDSLLPFMTKRRHNAGESLFRQGDQADEMFYVVRGALALPELDVRIGPGEIVGEIGLFSPNQERTSSAQCETDCDLLSITRQKVLDVWYTNPSFGFHLLHLITGRLVDNINHLRDRPAKAGSHETAPGGASPRP